MFILSFCLISTGFTGMATYVFFLIRLLKKSRKDYDNKITVLHELLESTSEEKEMYKQRTIKAEDAIEKGYGIKVRIEKTIVKTYFSKLEWVVLVSGLHKLIGNAKNVDDAKIYFKLNDKIQDFLQNMDEENPETPKES